MKKSKKSMHHVTSSDGNEGDSFCKKKSWILSSSIKNANNSLQGKFQQERILFDSALTHFEQQTQNK